MNENTKHTPGPWETFPNAGGHVVQGEAFETIAVLPKWDKEHTDEQTANARLIASAPGLRCMLQRLLDGVLMLPELPRTLCALDIEQARAAIAKATAE